MKRLSLSAFLVLYYSQFTRSRSLSDVARQRADLLEYMQVPRTSDGMMEPLEPVATKIPFLVI